jgi:Ca-activated chloride channel family protein
MNKTRTIFLLAGILAVGAMWVASGQASKPLAGPAPTPIAAPAPPPAPGSTRTQIQKGQVILSTASSNRFVHTGGGELHVDVSLAGIARKSAVKRQPVNLALVIDHSGSMAGKKIADARAAARAVVAQLSDGDRLALVIYDDTAKVLVASTVISERSRDQLRREIDTIRDAGGTALWAGLDTGRREVLRHAREGYVSRVVLISDGLANVGISSQSGISALARQALNQGVHVTSMGVGADFDSNMMTSIAEHGGGHYYFIDDSAAMATIFSKELQTLLATVAKQAELHLAMAPGVELLEVYGYTFEQRGAAAVVKLPDIYGGLDRKVMLRLRVPAGAEGNRQLASVALHFIDAETGKPAVAETRALVAQVTDQKKIEGGQDGEVVAKAEQATAAKNLDRAMEAYGKGDVAGAQGVLRAQIAKSAGLNAKLKNKKLAEAIDDMRDKLGRTASAAPASEEGKLLQKAGKYRAYKLAK